MELILNPEERELLATVLQERHQHLLREISHTDHISFKRTLVQRGNMLESMIEKLEGVATA